MNSAAYTGPAAITPGERKDRATEQRKARKAWRDRGTLVRPAEGPGRTRPKDLREPRRRQEGVDAHGNPVTSRFTRSPLAGATQRRRAQNRNARQARRRNRRA